LEGGSSPNVLEGTEMDRFESYSGHFIKRLRGFQLCEGVVVIIYLVMKTGLIWGVASQPGIVGGMTVAMLNLT